jgi:hypothetical protein
MQGLENPRPDCIGNTIGMNETNLLTCLPIVQLGGSGSVSSLLSTNIISFQFVVALSASCIRGSHGARIGFVLMETIHVM